MKNQRLFLLTVGFVCNAAIGAAAIETNQVHQQALEVLRKTMEALEPLDKNQPKPHSNHELTFAEAEKLYLQGKITAKEFQKYLDDHKLEAAKASSAGGQDRALEVLRDTQAGRPTPPSADTNLGTPALPDGRIDAVVAPDQSKLSELEQKMDELLRLKAARESVTATNLISTTTTNVPSASAPKNRRQRLDDLLKIYIEGKIRDAEYKEQRARLIAGPD